jgi:hypothetical protein
MKFCIRHCLIAILLASTASHAAELTIDLFGGGVGAVPSATFDEGGQSVTLTAEAAGGATTNVFLTTFASGVEGGATAGIDVGESLIFDFSPEPVDLLTSIVVDVTAPESVFADFLLIADGVNVGVFNVQAGVSTIDFGTGVAGDVFTFQGLQGDSFFVRAVTVNNMPVSEPGTLVLAMLGLAAVGLARRRRR